MIRNLNFRNIYHALYLTLLLSAAFSLAHPDYVLAHNQAGFGLFQPLFIIPDSDLIIQNLEATEAQFALAIYDDNGNNVYSSSVTTLEPNVPQKILSGDLVGISPGIYSLITYADRTTQSLVATQRPNSNGDNLAFYQGEGEPRDTHWLAPIYRDVGEVYSSIYVQNVSSGPTNITIHFYNLSGQVINTSTKNNLPANASTSFRTSEIINIPSGFIGWAEVSGTGNIAAMLEDSSPRIYENRMPIKVEPININQSELFGQYYLPRLFKAYDEGAGSRTSQVVLVNPGEVEATLAITYTSSENIAFYASLITLSSKEMQLIDLANETYLASDEVYSAIITSSTPVGISEVTHYDTDTPLPVGTYQYSRATEQRLPRLIQQGDRFSAFSIQNTGANVAQGSVVYNRLDGTSAGQTNFSIPVGGYVRLKTLDISQLGTNFEGGAIISSTELVAVQVDEYVVSPNPIPTITSLSPSSVRAGSPGFTLTVNGVNFLIGSVIQWNGSPLTTTYVSPIKLQSSIAASNLFNPQTVAITVENPTPGGGTSNSRDFTITDKTFVYMPLSIQNWPPQAHTPILDTINNPDQDNKYIISWTNPSVGSSYILEEAWNPEFTNAGVVYQGPSLSWAVPDEGKIPDTYYYRVKAKNPYTESGWSTTQSVTIYPLYVGVKGRWDGKGFLHPEEPGFHETFHCDSLTEADTIRCNFSVWYDPDPIGWGAEFWKSYYSVTTGSFKSSDKINDPSRIWDYSWMLSYSSWFNSGDTVRIDGQKFTVTGPHSGYTTYGKAIQYWEFVNQDKFIFFDEGDGWTTYYHAGDVILRYDAGSSSLLIYFDLNRHVYYQGKDQGYTYQWITNLSAATSLPGSPPVPMFSSTAPQLDQPTLREKNSLEDGLRFGLPRE